MDCDNVQPDHQIHHQNLNAATHSIFFQLTLPTPETNACAFEIRTQMRTRKHILTPTGKPQVFGVNNVLRTAANGGTNELSPSKTSMSRPNELIHESILQTMDYLYGKGLDCNCLNTLSQPMCTTPWNYSSLVGVGNVYFLTLNKFVVYFCHCSPATCINYPGR